MDFEPGNPVNIGKVRLKTSALTPLPGSCTCANPTATYSGYAEAAVMSASVTSIVNPPLARPIKDVYMDEHIHEKLGGKGTSPGIL